jgi:hypothetical protein
VLLFSTASHLACSSSMSSSPLVEVSSSSAFARSSDRDSLGASVTISRATVNAASDELLPRAVARSVSHLGGGAGTGYAAGGGRRAARQRLGALRREAPWSTPSRPFLIAGAGCFPGLASLTFHLCCGRVASLFYIHSFRWRSAACCDWSHPYLRKSFGSRLKDSVGLRSATRSQTLE